MELFQDVLNLLVLIGGAALAIERCQELFNKPILWGKKKFAEREELRGQIKTINEDIAAIKQQNTDQNELIEKISAGNMTLLRHRMEELYDTHKTDRKLTETESEYLEEMFKAYDAQGGNGRFHKLYDRMQKWEVVPDEEE